MVEGGWDRRLRALVAAPELALVPASV
jgi:hypothetical protein